VSVAMSPFGYVDYHLFRYLHRDESVYASRVYSLSSSSDDMQDVNALERGLSVLYDMNTVEYGTWHLQALPPQG
jgi:hypothetical protein